MAIEDAIVLAKCLRDIPGLAAAFAAYTQLRRARVEQIVAYSARIGRTKTAGPVGRRLRDLMMPLALKLFANSTAHASMYAYHIDWDEPIARGDGTGTERSAVTAASTRTPPAPRQKTILSRDDA